MKNHKVVCFVILYLLALELCCNGCAPVSVRNGAGGGGPAPLQTGTGKLQGLPGVASGQPVPSPLIAEPSITIPPILSGYPKVAPRQFPPPKIPPHSKIAYLTFDDGPNPVGGKPTNGTQNLLDILTKHHVRATFFLVGLRASANPDLVWEIANDGNVIGNHTWSHCDIRKVTGDAFALQIKNTNDIIFKITGEHPTLFRSPRGLRPDKSEKDTLKSDGMKLEYWNVDTRDWAGATDSQILESIQKGIDSKHNLVILFHDYDFSALDQAIDLLEKNGYYFDTLDHKK
jgi:peptidoglycan-N-acetylglucosamine deacetylase